MELFKLNKLTKNLKQFPETKYFEKKMFPKELDPPPPENINAV